MKTYKVVIPQEKRGAASIKHFCQLHGNRLSKFSLWRRNLQAGDDLKARFCKWLADLAGRATLAQVNNSTANGKAVSIQHIISSSITNGGWNSTTILAIHSDCKLQICRFASAPKTSPTPCQETFGA